MEPETGGVTRRTLLSAGAGVPVSTVLLTACGGTSTGTDGSGGYGAPAAPPASESPAPADDSLAAVADIPDGGALVVQDGPDGTPVVLVRHRDGEVVAFSAICTHKGCTVQAERSALRCPCHGSTFDLSGKNTGGPAPSPLPAVAVTVTGGRVRPA